MNKYLHLRDKAIVWRKKGTPLPVICKRLSLSKGTVYYWIKNVPVKAKGSQLRTPAQEAVRRRAVRKMIEKYRALRQLSYDSAYKEAPKKFLDSTFRDFIVLYLCEGYRRNRNTVSIVNSNDQMMSFCHKILKGLTKKKMIYCLQCHIDNNEKSLKLFWGRKLNIPPSFITVIRKSNSGNMAFRKWRSVNGVFSITINDTYLRSKIQAWMDYLQTFWL